MFQIKYENIIGGFNPPWTTKICCAYILKHIQTGILYIGSTSNIYKRRRYHCLDFLSGNHINKNLQELFNKHPYFELGVYIVSDYYNEEQKREKAYDIEQYLLNYYSKFGNLANVATDARKNNLGKKHTEEAKLKVSLANKGRKPSEETRAKLRASMNDPIRKAKMLAIHVGRKASEETKQKIKLRINRPEFIQYLKDIMKDKQRPISIDNVKYPSIMEASRKLKISKQTIRWRLKSPYFNTYLYL